VDGASASVKPAAASPAPPAVVPAAGAATASKDPEQSGLNFVDPDLFLAEGQRPSAVPVGSAASTALPEAGQVLELEDPVVDHLLTAPQPPPPPPPSAPPAPRAAPPVAAANPDAARAAARVPIARTASLAAAATKLAAASAARSAAKSAAAPRPAVPVAASVRAAPAKPPAPLRPLVQPLPAPEVQPVPKTDAPNLASWAHARAAATAVPRVQPAPPVPTIAPPGSAGAKAPAAAAPTGAAAPAAAAAPVPVTAAPQAAASPAAAPMDRDFIARNQVVERYLSGRLPLKGATDFERFCHDHPELLDEIGLPERVNAGLRLLEASGKPEPWEEGPRPLWQKPQVTLALAGVVLIFAVMLAIVAGHSAGKSHRIAELQKQATERALDPATSRREIRLLPSREGASNSPAIIIGGAGGAQLADFKIDETRSPYHTFRVTIDRIDQGRVAIITNLEKDSNGHLRIALNSSALGPGNYQLTLEGLDWRGEPQPDSWVTIGVAR